MEILKKSDILGLGNNVLYGVKGGKCMQGLHRSKDSHDPMLKKASLDIKLSDPRAIRIANLKRRHADMISKRQSSTLVQLNGKYHVVISRREKERQQMELDEGKARLEAKAIRAEIELKEQRQQAREAARAALEKMERTVDVDDNIHSMRELEALIGSSLSCHHDEALNQLGSSELRSPLERLGLHLKPEYMMGDDDDELLMQDMDLDELDEGKARLEAKAIRAEIELKEQRQQAREAARAALEKMERTVDIDDNIHSMRELEALIGSSLSCHHDEALNQLGSSELRSPLERLGLHLKPEYMMGDDDDELLLQDMDLEEGEIT